MPDCLRRSHERKASPMYCCAAHCGPISLTAISERAYERHHRPILHARQRWALRGRPLCQAACTHPRLRPVTFGGRRCRRSPSAASALACFDPPLRAAPAFAAGVATAALPTGEARHRWTKAPAPRRTPRRLRPDPGQHALGGGPRRSPLWNCPPARSGKKARPVSLRLPLPCHRSSWQRSCSEPGAAECRQMARATYGPWAEAAAVQVWSPSRAGWASSATPKSAPRSDSERHFACPGPSNPASARRSAANRRATRPPRPCAGAA